MKSMLIGAFVCLQLSALILAAPAAEQQALPKCFEQILTITGDNIIHELYIDGILVTPANADDWRISGSVNVPASAKVIAVKVEDLHQVAGILASGSNFVSDGSWKCTNKFYSNWGTRDFSDAGWNLATVIGQHGVDPWGNIAGISANAYWIWTRNNVYGPSSDKIVYCRRRLPECVDTTCVEQTLTITGDNKIHELYIDGTSVTPANADNWRQSGTAHVPASAEVIAVKVEDFEVVAGILASGSNFVSDGTWKCTSTLYPGWHTKNYGDSHWPAATVIGKHGVSPWGNIAGISTDAYWIWTRNHVYGPTSDKVVYCRKHIVCGGGGGGDECPGGSGTGSACITSCHGRADGDYQSCNDCSVFATCSNGYLYDNRDCAASGRPEPLQWDDVLKRCEWSSTTCKKCGDEVVIPGCSGGTGPRCITSCNGRADGDYQSCNGCQVFASCSNGRLYDDRDCALNHDGNRLWWDDNLKRCEYTSSTCRCPN